MRLVFVLVIVIVLAIGVAVREELITAIGVGIYIMYQIVDLVYSLWQLKRPVKAQTEEKPPDEELKKSPLEKITNIIEGILPISGFIILAMGQPGPGLALWVSAILFYFIAGVVFQHVTGTQLRMGYGGWYTPRKRKQSSSLHSKSYNRYVRRR